MKVSPYLFFNGNCLEAIALYEKAFGVKAEVMRYKDAPPSEGYTPPPGTENLVMHARLASGEAEFFLCDMPPSQKYNFGDGIAVMVTMKDSAEVKAVFNTLREGGRVDMDIQETFWSKCFCSLEDKFGVAWMLSV